MEKEIFYTVNPELFDVEASQTISEEPKEEDKHFGIYGLLVDAIQNKWESINNYKSYIATLNQDEIKDKEILDAFNQVLEKELESVLILQNCLINFDKQTEEVLDDSTISF